ncbi:nucleotidyltransferase domain-containing protein [Amycolatopsis rifamycinica]|uniref:Amino acid transporter n=1 Tax=Amycolatopsis rifamycinica TaxID=287986 RepID=A0A066TSH5_9PSEU|nr:amino acid transporter [Amycolatopsis rifamycinica]KDN16487.1 amino acid transporter [Amycolatopsis rifamycinica]
MNWEWEPASLSEVAGLFSRVRVPWWIAGGYAIELAVGRAFREHADVDVLLLRRDQRAIQEALPSWEWWAADPPGTLRPWARGEVLGDHIDDVWCRPSASAPWRIQLMLDNADGGAWVSRRNPAVRREIASLGRISAEGVPYLAPEVQLFAKAHATRPKDEEDFEAALPVLDAAQRRWLAEALEATYGPHPWLGRL